MNHENDSGKTKYVAVIVTEYRYNSHAEVILGRLLGDFAYEAQIKVTSIYTDQVPENDMSREAAGRLGIPIYSTIRETVRAEHHPEPIDGVIIIGEHGDYPDTEKGQRMYPRRRMLEETLLALDELKINVPIFSDKHLSYDTQEAMWMYLQLKQREIPFMGGSSIPHADHVPAYDDRKLNSLQEIVVISFSNLIEGYGFHAIDLLQSLVEKRQGGESGVKSVQVTEGMSVWEAMDREEWPEDLMLQALSTYPDIAPTNLREREPNPLLMVIEYRDGTKGYVVQFKELVEQWGFAFRTANHEEVIAARCNSQTDRPFDHFERLTQMIEAFMITRQPPFKMERTLLTTGLINTVVESYCSGEKLNTPLLNIIY